MQSPIKQQMCKQCPLNDDYRFLTQCTIKSCKNFSPFTVNRCLGLDVKFAGDDKPVSDIELLHYKFNDKEVSIKDVSYIRKKSVDNVKHILTLHKLISHIAEHETPISGVEYDIGVSPAIDNILNSKPLRIKLLGFKPWMLKFVFDDKYVESVIGNKFKTRHLLGLKTKEYSNIVNIIKTLCSGKTLFESII